MLLIYLNACISLINTKAPVFKETLKKLQSFKNDG